VSVPESELAQLRKLSGYDQMLEIDRVCRQHQIDEPTLRSLLASSTPSSTSESHQPNDANHWDTSHKAHETVQSPQPQFVDRSQFHFAYDPSRQAQERRQQVNQAILCSACGVALGIPDVRPIKVTCPSCMFEMTFTQ